jgi:DNA repair exonuclease SbcCD ATPase subunit
LVKCPKCGAGVGAPTRTWSVSKRTKKPGAGEVVFATFECPECGHKFRTNIKDEMKEELSIKGMAEKIKGIEGELTNTLKNLREKLKTLETERSNLILEIDGLKKMAEAKADALESEVGMLREEVKSLKQLLGVGEMDT